MEEEMLGYFKIVVTKGTRRSLQMDKGELVGVITYEGFVLENKWDVRLAYKKIIPQLDRFVLENESNEIFTQT